MKVLTLNELRSLGAKLTKETFNPDAFTYVDLGLPSGRLWATENAPGHYTFDEAVNTFGELLPKASAMMELIEKCECTWDVKKKGLDIAGPNGNSIFLPAAGYTQLTPDVKAKDDEGEYWIHCQALTRYMNFDSRGVCPIPILTYHRSYGFSVRPCRESR